MASGWRERLLKVLPGVKLDEPMSRHTTFRIGGPADAYVEVHNRGELAAIVRFAREEGVPVFWLGWGSNLLVRDGGLRGIAARLRGEFETAEFLSAERVRAGAGLRVPQLVSLCAERGLEGSEPLVGVPGTVGGALVMNAGTREGEIGPLVVEVEVFDEQMFSPRILAAKDIEFCYRRSSLENKIVLSGLLQLKAGDRVAILARVQRHQQKRLLTQPVHTYNVGSIFKNPPGRFVAQLIEQAGLKGAAQGGARISPMHANFIENFAGAKASEVLALVERARAAVKAAAGLDLELEMKVIGEP